MIATFDPLAAGRDLASKADLRAEINAAVIKMMLPQIAVAGALFAALKLL